jgi:hypothetical protein
VALGVLAVVPALVPTEAWQSGLALLGRGATRPLAPPADLPLWPPPEDDAPGFGPIRVSVGDFLPDLDLEDLDGRKFRPAHPAAIPAVIELGSATCPICVGGLDSMRKVAERYAGRAEFFFVYCREAHRSAKAEGEYIENGRPRRQAANAAERREGAKLLRSSVEPARRLLLDGFGTGSLYEPLFGGSGADDSLIVVGTDGRVALVSRWAYADEVEAYLKGLP